MRIETNRKCPRVASRETRRLLLSVLQRGGGACLAKRPADRVCCFLRFPDVIKVDTYCVVPSNPNLPKPCPSITAPFMDHSGIRVFGCSVWMLCAFAALWPFHFTSSPLPVNGPSLNDEPSHPCVIFTITNCALLELGIQWCNTEKKAFHRACLCIIYIFHRKDGLHHQHIVLLIVS